ncbi:MAG: hypothetical protein ACLTSZ_05860 [Lachnospiraceae bacterium]
MTALHRMPLPIPSRPKRLRHSLPDGILKNTDESALGDNVSFDATDSSALEQTEAQQTEAAQSETTPSGEFDITTSDNYSESENTTEAQTETATEASSETTSTDGNDLVTSDIEIIPLSDFVLSPVTSEATNYKVYPAGLQELTVSFERDDIIAGSGTVSAYNAVDSSLVETVNMNDEKKVTISPLDDDELNELGWTDGYKAVLTLSAPLAQNATYFVAMSQTHFLPRMEGQLQRLHRTAIHGCSRLLRMDFPSPRQKMATLPGRLRLRPSSWTAAMQATRRSKMWIQVWFPSIRTNSGRPAI